MIEIGISSEGIPDVEIRKLDNGYVVPDSSLAEIHRKNRQKIDQRVETAKLADELGYEYLFFSEHHFGTIGANSPNPIQTQIAIARETENVRLAQMANVLPWHDPPRLAESIAMLDVASEGRAEVGVTRGFGNREASILGQYWGNTTENERKDEFTCDESVEILKASWTEPFVSHRGEFHSVPPQFTEWDDAHEYQYLEHRATDASPADAFELTDERQTVHSIPVFPQPLQEPHPQLWSPAMSVESVREGAKNGMNVCSHLSDFEAHRERVEAYYDAAREANWPDHHEANAGTEFKYGWDADRRRGISAIVPVLNTDVVSDEAIERYKLGLEFGLSQNKSRLPPEEAHDVEIDATKLLRSNDAPIVGSADYIAERLSEFKRVCGYEDLAVILQFESWGLTHEEILTQIESFASDVRFKIADAD